MIWDAVVQNSPALIIAVPMLAAFITPVISRFSARLRNVWVLSALIFTEILVLLLLYQVYNFGTQVYVFGASPYNLTVPPDSGGIPIRIIFEVDSMSIFMAFTASTVALAGAIYSTSCEKEQTGQDKYYALLLLMTVGMLGMMLTGDLFNFFVFLEINSLASAALVAYRVDKGIAVEAAFKYAVVSTLGGLMVLFAIGLLYGQYDALNIAMVAHRMQATGFTDLDKIAMALLTVSLAMKAGAIPMHFWVPDGYGKSPGAITAMLVTASQSSLYGLFRMCFTVFGLSANTYTLGWFLIVLGILSMFVGVTMALIQHDIKRLMAYHAISQTGYMLLGVGVGLATLGTAAFHQYGLAAMEGGIFHIINHAMYKGLLFLTAGAIIYRVGTSDLNKMGGLGHTMKYTMIFFMIGALAIAGIPPFNGFASKLLIYESVYMFNPLLSIIAMVVSILTLASFVKVFHSAFMGPKVYDVKEVPRPMLIAMGILTFFIILFGISPNIAIHYLVAPAAHALSNPVGYITRVLGGGTP
ncbi:formate hydrogenlyase subunit 3/multisubunit Na+/H+ antiporter, MnhD subunit [Aciduliprofundum sp. MAR08-339]|uniref:proton-conducting transporter transmembrane domain-containing protein n=1 Tax=Aciduliprofundum sp. (strain MAR08-339) TaxID=673860 RepID=UPI0002A48203|nr:formate hydrogenlyase subunit 3/multisubunit Na+/H+ antiporter, MnhD subunit [Aciduliprofundum sp. MAR08-339]